MEGVFRECLRCSTFCLPGATGAKWCCYSGLSPVGNSVVWRGITLLHGKRVCGGGQTGQVGRVAWRTAVDTLLLRHLWLPDVGEETGVGGSALGKVHPGLAEAQIAVYSVSDLGSVSVLLSVVLPPAHWTEGQRGWRLQSPVPATRASKTNRCRPHARLTGFEGSWFTCFDMCYLKRSARCVILRGCREAGL